MDYNQCNYEEQYLEKPEMKPVTNLEEPVSLKEWIITLLLLMIPVVNIVLMFVFAFNKDEKKSKSNFFKAYLIFTGVALAIYLIFLIFIFGIIFAMAAAI
ncbi:MAG: hypothetical protein IKL73_05735 [Lachnospiraceae bacterium]|nr:hypothetical protein [Lachnospiraceae bacterium]